MRSSNHFWCELIGKLKKSWENLFQDGRRFREIHLSFKCRWIFPLAFPLLVNLRKRVVSSKSDTIRCECVRWYPDASIYQITLCCSVAVRFMKGFCVKVTQTDFKKSEINTNILSACLWFGLREINRIRESFKYWKCEVDWWIKLGGKRSFSPEIAD